MTRNQKKSMITAWLALCPLFASSAMACTDSNWTKAITEAMGRAPKAGECNVKLYGEATTHGERVIAVRKTLNQIYAVTPQGVATQKLPLKLPERRQDAVTGAVAPTTGAAGEAGAVQSSRGFASEK